MMTKWLKEIEGVQTKQSLVQHALAIREFAQSQPQSRTVDRVSRRIAGDFVSGVLMQAGGSQKTANRKISSLSSMWRWLRRRGFVEDNPWQGQGSFSGAGKQERPKRAYEAPELVRLLNADLRSIVGERYGLVLFDLIRLGLLTGCRIGELCQLRVEYVLGSQQAFRIPKGKTENAWRVMPVHRTVWPVIQRRMASSSDGWIFSGLTPAGPDGKRSWIVVKRYATFRQAILGQGGEVDFHRFRRSFATYLERASTHSIAVNSSVIAELMGHVKPTLALAVYSLRPMPLEAIRTDDVLAVLTPIWNTKSETASRVRGRIERILDAAKAKGLRSGENPARWRGHLDKLLPARRKLARGHHAALAFEKVPAFIEDLREREAVAAMALEFCILNASRSGEVLGARWSEIDRKTRVWTVPADRMKAGVEHRVPLTPQAVAVLDRAELIRVSEYVFPGHKRGRPLSSMAMEMMLRRMKVDVTVHGFRSSFRDWAGERTAFPREIAEIALAHVVGDETERAYRRGDALEKRRKLMEAWSAFVSKRRTENNRTTVAILHQRLA